MPAFTRGDEKEERANEVHFDVIKEEGLTSMVQKDALSSGSFHKVLVHFVVPLRCILPHTSTMLDLVLGGVYFIMYVCAKSLQLCLILFDPIDCSPPGSSVHGILQARTLEWVAILVKAVIWQ